MYYSNVIPALAKPVTVEAKSTPAVFDEKTSISLSPAATEIDSAATALLFVPIVITGPSAGDNNNGVPTGLKLLLLAGAW